ncbi:MAG: Fpg/Nei family DNA glycosylase [Verrucomicrobiota bacterium]|nr:Fpg/Nei family DNA glycosylase [Verrucomicrobiota bacterium]
MPELAEVEFFRKQWNHGLGRTVRKVLIHEHAAVFRGANIRLLRTALTGAKLLSSEAAGKQMLFRFSGDAWLGLHLGMTGRLHAEPRSYEPEKHDHFVLVTGKHALVFTDQRMFGKIGFSIGSPPIWWTRMAPPILSDAFTVEAVSAFLRRRARAPIKAVLLMQERFPGIGNWMADEVLWRAAIHSKKLAGRLTSAEVRALHREARWVCRQALKIIGRNLADPPKSWLFPHRWEDGGLCPKTKKPLVREEVGGRMTCWSPARQK